MCQKFQKNLFAMNFWNYFFWYCFDFELEVGISNVLLDIFMRLLLWFWRFFTLLEWIMIMNIKHVVSNFKQNQWSSEGGRTSKSCCTAFQPYRMVPAFQKWPTKQVKNPSIRLNSNELFVRDEFETKLFGECYNNFRYTINFWMQFLKWLLNQMTFN